MNLKKEKNELITIDLAKNLITIYIVYLCLFFLIQLLLRKESVPAFSLKLMAVCSPAAIMFGYLKGDDGKTIVMVSIIMSYFSFMAIQHYILHIMKKD